MAEELLGSSSESAGESAGESLFEVTSSASDPLVHSSSHGVSASVEASSAGKGRPRLPSGPSDSARIDDAALRDIPLP